MGFDLLLVALGGGCGAVLRAFLSQRIGGGTRRGTFPWGTLLINCSGTLMLALLTRLTAGAVPLLLGTGLMGGYTTFSTFNKELTELLEGKRVLSAGVYFCASYAAGLGGAWVILA